ncbi:MAG: hypothetical protein IJ597_02980 [Synergistaceae bacterium]|nr:hypothetical protein [Synergistaceae bacterium]
MSSVNTKHKDRLFRFIFGYPENIEWTLSLFNAISGTNYNDPSAIEFNTIEDAIYLGMKNDISFIFFLLYELDLWEHQSSFNPNMPIRCLIHIAQLYDKFIQENNLNRYSRKILKLPRAKFYCFYNGTEDQPEEKILKLSDSFGENSDSDLEVRVKMININYGKNKKLMDSCQPLKEYAWIIEMVRQYEKTLKSLEKAFDFVLSIIPEDFVIRKFLLAHKAEVKGMFLTEYDEKKQRKLDRDEAREEGFEEGIAQGRMTTATAMLKEKLPLSLIMKISELSEIVIRGLAEKINVAVVQG